MKEKGLERRRKGKEQIGEKKQIDIEGQKMKAKEQLKEKNH
jgi:hypothetical protein